MRTFKDGVRSVMLVTLSLWAAGASSGADAPPDLRLQWVGKVAPVRGPVGTKAGLEYELTNIGGSAAFAVIVRAQSTVGQVTAPVRIQPGPSSGASVRRKVTFALVRGMRELCIDAVLQHRSGGDPPEANLDNNRICRAINVDSQAAPSEEAPR